ncbi:MAG: leucine-rich repeat protein, partial [Lachnospiraceae bacterium]|nr:leucine-rich repeat protein [Lachnospiraceae bacterium]
GHFYLDTSEIVDENAMYINLGRDKVYYLKDAMTENVKLCSMNFDGSNIDVIEDGLKTSMLLQYALLSNGDEYLFYITLNDEGTHGILNRYDIKKDKVETVINEDMCWYNVNGNSIYYTAYTDDGVALKKSNLSGKHIKTLNTDKIYTYGFVEDDKLFLYSYSEQAMCVLDLKGKVKTVLYDAKMDVRNYTYAYGEGWIYYVNADDGSVYRIRDYGTANSMLFEGRYIISIGYDNGEIWLQEGYYDANDELKLLRSYICYKDGTSLIVLDDADLMTTDDGIVYRQDGSGITICGYVGNEDAIYIPITIDGVPIVGYDTDNLPRDCRYYIIDTESSYEYEDSEDGTGVVITGFEESDDFTSFKIPDELGGKPVVEIGESVFAETKVTDIALPRTLKKIDKEAFYNCADLTYVHFNEGLEELEEGAFGKTGLTEVKLPESLSIIRDTVFAGTKLSSVYIPKNVALVSYTAFIYSELENIEVDPDNIIYTAIDGVLYSRDVKELHIVPCKKTGSFVIPAEVFNVNVGAFSWCNDITDISLEDGSQLKKVDRLAFVQCESLTKIDLSKAGETIESGAIYGCDNLSEVYFSPNMSTVPEDVFYDGVIPATLTKVGLGSNCECSIEWPENVEVIIYGEDE